MGHSCSSHLLFMGVKLGLSLKKKEDFCDGAGENNRNCKNGSNRTEKIKKLNT